MKKIPGPTGAWALGLVLTGLVAWIALPDRETPAPTQEEPTATSQTADPVTADKTDWLERVLQSGELVVLTRNAPTTFYRDRDGAEGLEYRLTQSFADHLGVEVRYEFRDTVAELLDAIEAGEGHLVAAGITHTAQRENGWMFGPAYQQIEQQVVCRRLGNIPDSIDSLHEVELAVTAHSSYVERLKKLRAEHPSLEWSARELSTEQLLEQVWREKLDCTVADSNIVAINRRYYPELQVAFPLTEKQDLAWILPDDADRLAGEVKTWMETLRDSDRLEWLLHRFYGPYQRFDYVDIRAFRRRVEDRLPDYRPLFESAAENHGLSWTLLAAQSYQESHWEPRAESPTGVRGMMMLTRPTARSVGVKNRLSAEQSIRGGARYLDRMMGRLPESITGRDRRWFALAAYNIGMGHIYDARKLARKQGKDPDTWHELAEVLPLLSQKQHYRDLKYGYARGTEPVRYVRRIREYERVLQRKLGLSDG